MNKDNLIKLINNYISGPSVKPELLRDLLCQIMDYIDQKDESVQHELLDEKNTVTIEKNTSMLVMSLKDKITVKDIVLRFPDNPRNGRSISIFSLRNILKMDIKSDKKVFGKNKNMGKGEMIQYVYCAKEQAWLRVDYAKS